jgi:hypothetical protein
MQMKLAIWFAGAVAGLVLSSAVDAPSAHADKPSAVAAPKRAAAPSLAGTWTLVVADVEHPDGSRSHDYGDRPKGLMMIDAQGRYSVQIYSAERPRFAGAEKQSGTPAELAAAVMGSSCHFGTLEVDAVNQTLTYHIDGATFPNTEGTQQVRRFELHGDELSYRVPPRANGNVPISVWRRVS